MKIAMVINILCMSSQLLPDDIVIKAQLLLSVRFSIGIVSSSPEYEPASHAFSNCRRSGQHRPRLGSVLLRIYPPLTAALLLGRDMLQSGSCPYSRCWWVGLAGLFSPATGVIGETGRLEDWEIVEIGGLG
jgi:hypothetical protein